MKIIQITSNEDETLTVLTDDGRIFAGYWKDCKFNWTSEITPDPHKLTQLPLNVIYEKNQDE
jgi:hypothetical protein